MTNGNESLYEYDAMGNVSSVTDAEGRCIQLAYDLNGNLTEILYPDGTKDLTEYDALGRVVQSMPRTGLATAYAYDESGNIVRVTQGEQTTAYEYDLLGRMVRQIAADGTETAYAYDALGNLVGQTDELGNRTTFSYTAESLLEQVTYANGASQSLSYDLAGNVIGETDAEGNAKERSGHQVSVGYVAKQLKDAGIIKYKGLFELYCSVSHAKTKIDPGTYELSTNYDYRALVKKMQVGSGAMVTTKVTIPEGYTMEQIFHKLEDENVCSYDDLMDAAANYSYNYSFIDQSMQGDAKRLEGFLFPDTYEFYQGMQASSAINKFLENFHDRLTAEMLEKADERGMTMQEVVTVASMIEKEAANDDERAMIAAVIYNRIEAGMPLQIDSTIMYVLPEHKDVLTVEDTKIDSPYNTYQNKGLPPTPIANPGLASLKATLSPASTQALYYALDAESGTHKFFTNYGEFQAFVAKQSYSQ